VTTTTTTTNRAFVAGTAPAAAASSVARNSPARKIKETVHTSVLGRDAGDADVVDDSSSTIEIGFAAATDHDGDASANANANESGSGWWGSGYFGGNSGNNNKGNEDASPGKKTNAHRKRRNNNARYDGLQQSLEDGTAGYTNNHNYDPPALASTVDPSSTSSVATDSLAASATTTREERVRQDCSYFYRGMEDGDTDRGSSLSPMHKTRSHRGTGRTAAAANSLLRKMSLRARLSGRVDGALFMSRYEKLNQVVDRPRRKSSARAQRHRRGQQYTGTDNSSSNGNDNHNAVCNGNDNHDLFLDEDDGGENGLSPSSYREHIPSPTNNVVMGATSLANPHGVRSSMFFEQDGRMLMRLPRDQVRLVMDYNLEPGILSVEQWRSRADAETTSQKLMKQHHGRRVSATATIERKRERRRKQREKEKRRRQRRKQRKREKKQQQKQQQQTKQPDCSDGDDGNSGQKGERSTDLQDPLATEGGGQLPPEVAAMKGDADPCNADRCTDESSSSSSDDDDSDYYYYDDDSDYDSDSDLPPESLLPELNYVITIPDDLYRRMVGEMSAKVFPPYWGFFKCCNQESEPADIRLALVILSVVMFLLFVGSLEWRTT